MGEGTGLPRALELLWKRPLGSGYSAIAVAEGHAVTSFDEDGTEFVGAFDPATGAELWRAEIGRRQPYGGRKPGPTSTPLVTGGRVFALSPAGRFVALDLSSGELRWSVDLPSEYGAAMPDYGFSTSPLAWQGKVLLLTGGSGGRAVSALDAVTGRRLWSSGDDSISYQTPSLISSSGRTRLVVLGDRELTGFDPQTGRVVWSTSHGGEFGPSGLDVSSAHVVAGSAGHFLLKYRRTGSVLLELLGEDGPELLRSWETRHIKRSYTVAVYHRGYFYGYDGSILSCVSAATGELAWRSRAPGDGAAMLLEGHLVVATKDGRLTVAPATAEGYREIASLALFDDRVWTPASFAGDSLYVRSFSEWARVRVVTER